MRPMKFPNRGYRLTLRTSAWIRTSKEEGSIFCLCDAWARGVDDGVWYPSWLISGRKTLSERNRHLLYREIILLLTSQEKKTIQISNGIKIHDLWSCCLIIYLLLMLFQSLHT